MKPPHRIPCRIRSLAVWQRWTAYGSLGLVLMLNLLAAAPQIHAWMHEAPSVAGDHGHGDCDHRNTNAPAEHTDDATCVVTQFANGQVGCEAALVVVATPLLREVATLPDTVAALSGRPDLQLPPGCGPPLV